MDNEPIVTLDRADIGAIGIKQDGARRVLEPGRFENGVWLATDLTAEPAEVQALAASAWTPSVISAVQALRQGQQSPPASLTRIAKDLIWRRATDAEASAMDAALKSQPIRIQRIYDGVQLIDQGGELYGALSTAMVALFGADRAAELLEPTE